MKRKIVTLLCGVMVTAMVLTACGSASASETSTTETIAEAISDGSETDMSQYAGTTIYGEAASVEDSAVTLSLGSWDEDSREFTASGDSLTVEVSDDVSISMNMSGGPGGDGEVPDKPGDASGDNNDPAGGNEQSPEKSGDDNGQPNGDGEAPEKPDGNNANGDAPEKPDGDNTNGDAPEKPDGDNTSSDAPEKPDEDNANSDAPEKPDGDNAIGAPSDMGDMTLSVSGLSEGTVLSITFDEEGNVSEVSILSGMDMSAMGGPGGAASGVDSYTAVNEYTEDTEISGESYSSTGVDENAILVSNGANVTLSDITVDRTSSDSIGGDSSSFYGVGAAILTTDGTTTIDGATITTDAAGGAGVFSYGDGITYVSNSTITTKENTSGGIHVAGGGTLYANDLTVETNGESSAAVRSDRGGGTMVVDGGTYTSNGVGSPAVYSTADITISNATLTATGSEAVCIEGLNSLRLTDCDLTGSMQDLSQNDCTWNVILYQSMSGDSEVGNSTFQMVGGSLTANNGGMFYTTNTESTFILSGVDITYAEDNDFFLKATGNSNQRGWGTSGANGADCHFTAIGQDMEGDVIWDSISQLDFYMTSGSTLTGAFIDDETAAGNGGSGYSNLYISEDSTWVVTADSTLTSLYNAGTIVDEAGNVVTIQYADGTIALQGTSDYTITVDSYSTSVDLSGASTID